MLSLYPKMMTNEHLIKIRLRTSTEEMDETVTYVCAFCKNCGSKIAIQLNTINDRGMRFEAIVGTLRVWCDQCGQAQEMTIRAKFTSPAEHLSSLTNLQH